MFKHFIAINAHACPILSHQIPGDKMNFKVSASDQQEVKTMLKEAVIMQQQQRPIDNKPKESQAAKTIKHSSSSYGCVKCCIVI